MIPEEGSILCEKPGICKFIMYDKVRVNVLPYLASSHVNIIHDWNIQWPLGHQSAFLSLFSQRRRNVKSNRVFPQKL